MPDPDLADLFPPDFADRLVTWVLAKREGLVLLTVNDGQVINVEVIEGHVLGGGILDPDRN